MMIVEAVCATCTERGPVAIFATLADGTQLALCRGCSEVLERARGFVARYHAERDLPDMARSITTEPQIREARDRPAARAAS